MYVLSCHFLALLCCCSSPLTISLVVDDTMRYPTCEAEQLQDEKMVVEMCYQLSNVSIECLSCIADKHLVLLHAGWSCHICLWLVFGLGIRIWLFCWA